MVMPECDEGHWIRCRDYSRQGHICPSIDLYGDRYISHEAAELYARYQGNHEKMCELVRAAYPEYRGYQLREYTGKEEIVFMYGPPSVAGE